MVKHTQKIFKIIRFTCLLAVMVLGLATIIGTGGGGGSSGNVDDGVENGSNGDDGDNNDIIEEKVDNPIIGKWYCKFQTSTTTQGSTSTSTSYTDIEFFPDGTYKSEPKSTVCTYSGKWHLNGNKLTERLTSGSGADYCRNVDTSLSRTYTINARDGRLEMNGTFRVNGTSVSQRITCD